MTRALRAPAGRRQPSPSAPPRRGLAAVAPALALALLPALVLTGCGGGDEAAPATTTSAPTATTGEPSPATAPGGRTAGGPDGEGTGGGGTAGTAVPDAGTTTPFAETYDVTVTGREVRPEPSAVDLRVGETLLLRVTADAGSEIHAHGFGELSVPVTPGQPVEVQLTAEEPGLFEVELHDPDLLLLQVAVR